MSGCLIAHCGAEYIDREGLKTLETPQGTATWQPIGHCQLVEAISGEIAHRGMTIRKEEFAVPIPLPTTKS
jgi:hypothetical protein